MKTILNHLSIIALLAVMVAACKPKEESSVKKSPLDESTIAVTLVPVQTGHYNVPIVSSGLISTGTESKLSFKVGGMISSIMVREGDAISKGQLLASLDLTELSAQVDQARNNVEKLKRDLERGQHLYKDSAATLEQIQNLQTAYDVARANFAIASFNKQFATIHATTSGKVIRKFVNEGEQVSSGTPVLMINSSAQNDWIVKIGLADIDWVRIKKGDRAKISLDAYPDEVFDGEVTLINEGTDPVNGLYLAEIKVNPAGKKLASGLFAKVEIVSSASKTQQRIPIEAIVEGNGKEAYVFIVNADGKSVKKIPVTIAYLTSDSVVIAKGLDQVKAVITAGAAFLTEFSTVQIAQQ